MTDASDAHADHDAALAERAEIRPNGLDERSAGADAERERHRVLNGANGQGGGDRDHPDGRLIDHARGAQISTESISLDDFYAYMPTHSYIFIPTRAMWPATSVNSRIGPIPLFGANGEPLLDKKGKPVKISASTWLDQNKSVEQMTWAPGQPLTILDKLIVLEGGWIDRPGATCFNLYHAPVIKPGDKTKAQRWIDHVNFVYPNNAEHIINWLAHRVQKPEEKINHALVLGGEQGIGKDTLIAPAAYAVGLWNCQEVSPSQVMGRFNGFLKSVILRISEARDLGDSDRFKFYDHMKTYTAAPPDVLRIDEKNLREYSVPNCCGVIVTTNHKTDGIYLSPDDRRHYVAWSDLTKEDARFQSEYWKKLWAWYAQEGNRAVAAYLRERDIRNFDPKAPPPKTAAFWAIVDANRSAEEPEIADAIDLLKNPKALTLENLQARAETAEFANWLKDRKNRRIIPHRLEKCGYAPVRNPDATDGLWIIGKRRQAVYAKNSLSLHDQIAAAEELRKCFG